MRDEIKSRLPRSWIALIVSITLLVSNLPDSSFKEFLRPLDSLLAAFGLFQDGWSTFIGDLSETPRIRFKYDLGEGRTEYRELLPLRQGFSRNVEQYFSRRLYYGQVPSAAVNGILRYECRDNPQARQIALETQTQLARYLQDRNGSPDPDREYRVLADAECIR